MTLDVYVPRIRKVDPFSLLTTREHIVLQHMQQGRSACEIAKLDYVTVSTVRTQIRGILIKLSAKSQLDAVAMANKRTSQHRCEKCEYRLACVS
jgi:DNA-binding NarL/FixJ family response regulator